jgi:hypothetical protein
VKLTHLIQKKVAYATLFRWLMLVLCWPVLVCVPGDVAARSELVEECWRLPLRVPLRVPLWERKKKRRRGSGCHIAGICEKHRLSLRWLCERGGCGGL